MGRKVNLGGKRLGSGSKMTVEMKNFGRSSHDQGFVFTTDQAFGTLVPAMCMLGTRGDTFYLDDIRSLVRTLPTNGPVFGSVKQQIDVFIAPMRLYMGPLHNNATGIGLKMDQVKMPMEKHICTTYASDFELKAANRASVAKDSLSAYIGLNASPMSRTNNLNEPYLKNALFRLMYWDIYKNYYANKQEEEGVVISGERPRRSIKQIAGSSGTEGTSFVIDKEGWNRTVNLTGPGGSVIAIRTKANMTTEEFKRVFELFVNINGQKDWKNMNELSDTLDPFVQDAVHVEKFNNGNDIDYAVRFQATNKISVIGEAGLPGARFQNGEEHGVRTERFPLKNIDDMREKILKTPIGEAVQITPDTPMPYSAELQQTNDESGKIREMMSNTMCGLGIKTHLSDIFNNWLQTDWLDGENGINEITSVQIKDGKFTMDDLNFKQKLFNMMNRIAVQDGSYDAWQTAVYGATGPMVSESPMYVGGFSSEIAFDEVVSTAASETEPLGSLAGRGATQNDTKKGGRNIKIKCTEACLIMVISSFTPRVTYSQGNEWWTELQTMDDLHKPDMDGIAFQVLPTGWMNGATERVDDTGRITSTAIGKQPSWTEYTTNVNKSFGDFAYGGPLEHLTINRGYHIGGTGELENGTTYIDPEEFNVIFADKKITAKPFWVQIAFNLTSRRVMSASQMPIM